MSTPSISTQSNDCWITQLNSPRIRRGAGVGQRRVWPTWHTAREFVCRWRLSHWHAHLAVVHHHCLNFLIGGGNAGEGRFSSLTSTRADFQKVLPADCLGKFERRKKTEAADAPVTAYSLTARQCSFTTLSELGGGGRNRTRVTDSIARKLKDFLRKRETIRPNSPLFFLTGNYFH